MNRTAGVIWTAASAIGFGGLVSLAKVAEGGKASTETMLFIRFLTATLIIGAWIGLRRRNELAAIDGRKSLHLLAMGGVLYLIQSYCFFQGVKHVPGALISILLYLYPAFVAVGAYFIFKERMSKTKVGALVLAMAGAALAIGPATDANSTGILYGIGTAVAYSVYILVGTEVLKGIDSLTASLFVFIGAAIAYGVVASVTGWQLPATTASWSACIGLGVLSVIAMGGFLVGIQVIGPVNASTVSALEPIVTAILGSVIWGQHLLPIQLLGGAVILGAVIWLVRSR